MDVVTVGEALALFVADEAGPLEQASRFTRYTAGAETNVAIGLSRLGLKVGWAGRLGSDSMARFLIAALLAEGVDCTQVVCDAAQRTGFMFKGRVLDESDPPIEYHRKGSAASLMAVGDVDEDWLLGARHLHASGVFPALSPSCRELARHTMALMRRAGRTVSFDPNLRPTLWRSGEEMRREVNHLAALADWVFPGLEEGRLLTGQAAAEGIARHYLDLGATLVVVKLGAQGAYFDGASGRGHVAAVPVDKVIDTVGAGDGLAVGVISALLEGSSSADAVRRGTWIGARAVQVVGDTEGLPSRAQLREAGI